jgi:hypothetical protein
MISYAQFGSMRLASFRPDVRVAELNDWEFEDHLWVGEAVGYSEWLRLEEQPEVLRSLSLDFAEFPKPAAERVLRHIGLQLQAGMTLDELRNILGEPARVYRFVPDRVTYEFLTTGQLRYKVSCTVLQEGGLKYLVVMVPFGE